MKRQKGQLAKQCLAESYPMKQKRNKVTLLRKDFQSQKIIHFMGNIILKKPVILLDRKTKGNLLQIKENTCQKKQNKKLVKRKKGNLFLMPKRKPVFWWEISLKAENSQKNTKKK